MTPTRVRPGTSGKSADAADLELLAQIAAKFKHHHSEVVAHESQALQDAYACGDFAIEARPIWYRSRASGECKLKWAEWCQKHLGVCTNTVLVYKRIFDNWDRLKALPPDQQSIRAAIRFLNGEKQSTRSKDVAIAAAVLLETSEKNAIQNVPPEKLMSFVNDVLKAAHFTKSIKISHG
jgi:hypothetical protein